MKCFLKKLLFLFNFLFIVICINYYFDPGKKFIDYNLISEDKNILVLENIDERLLKASFILKDRGKKNTVILGSSRSMTIGEENKNILNLAVSGANLKDDLALLYRYILVNKKVPENIIIGIDPWVFNKVEDTRYKVLEEDYQKMINLINGENNKISKNIKVLKDLEYLIKISTLKDSISILKNRGLKRNKPINATNDSINEIGNVYLKNNRRLQYSRKMEDNFSNDNWKIYKDYQLSSFKEIDIERKKIFENFIIWARKEKINLIIYLPPYNPKHYKEYILKTPYNNLFNEIIKYIKELENKYSIKVIGTYFDSSLKDSDFYDGIHKRNVNINIE